MRIALVDNLVMPAEGSLGLLDVHPHLGLLSLAAAAEAHGHEVRIYDPKRLLRAGRLPYDATLYARAAQDLVALRPDAVGFTTLGCSFLFALGTAAALKRRQPDLPILLGGPHATMLHKEILERFDQIDAIVRHEADETFPEVLEKLETRGFDAIAGISWHGAGGSIHATDGKPKVEDLDRLPLLSYEHYPIAELGLDLLRIEAGRGCPFACTFCSTATFFQRSFRLKSAERLVFELDRLHARYGISEFKLDHDMFTVNRRKVLEFCEAVEDRGYRWRASARVDCVDEEMLTKMARAGCSELYFGIETGSVRMQAITKKHLDIALVEPVLGIADRLGIETTASFITGYPQELAQDQDDTLDLLGRCSGQTCLAQLHILTPEPGTPLFDVFGPAMQYDGYANPFNAHIIDAGDRALIEAHRDIFSTYYYYPGELPRFEQIFAVEAIAALRFAGPIITAYASRAFGGRLSAFVQALRSWAGTNAPSAQPNCDTIVAFVTSVFGAQHHLTSLFRFAFCAQQASAGSSAPSRPSTEIDWCQPYRLNAGLRVLRELHDCPALITKIQADPGSTALLEETEAGKRGCHLVGAVDGSAVSIAIDPAIETILGLFEQPQSFGEILRFIGGRRRKREFSVLAELVEAGILAAVGETASAPAAR